MNKKVMVGHEALREEKRNNVFAGTMKNLLGFQKCLQNAKREIFLTSQQKQPTILLPTITTLLFTYFDITSMILPTLKYMVNGNALCMFICFRQGVIRPISYCMHG